MSQAAPVIAEPTLDQLESEAIRLEAIVARVRARQMHLLRLLREASVAALDGARNFEEWTAARLDVTPATARDLVRTADAAGEHPGLAAELAAGDVSFERAAATMKLAAAGAGEAAISDSRGHDLAGVLRLAARHRRLTAAQERRTHADRYLTLQPSLDQSHVRLHGVLPGYDGQLVAEAVAERGDRLHAGHQNPSRASRPQRAADALVSMALDTLDPTSERSEPRAERAPLVTVFVDAELAARSTGEAGVEVAAGPRIGPATLERLMCEGRVEVTTTDARPLGIGLSSRVVPPRLRRFVLHRDGGCVVEGCESRYRLQVHHVVPASEGGRTDADNLVTLCWYHHHVVVHGQGRRIDPSSPPRRIRFRRPDPARGPPG